MWGQRAKSSERALCLRCGVGFRHQRGLTCVGIPGVVLSGLAWLGLLTCPELCDPVAASRCPVLHCDPCRAPHRRPRLYLAPSPFDVPPDLIYGYVACLLLLSRWFLIG